MFFTENLKHIFFIQASSQKGIQNTENICTHLNGHRRAIISHDHQKWLLLVEATLALDFGIFVCWKMVLFPPPQKTTETPSTESHSSDWVSGRFGWKFNHMARGKECVRTILPQALPNKHTILPTPRWPHVTLAGSGIHALSCSWSRTDLYVAILSHTVLLLNSCPQWGQNCSPTRLPGIHEHPINLSRLNAVGTRSFSGPGAKWERRAPWSEFRKNFKTVSAEFTPSGRFCATLQFTHWDPHGPPREDFHGHGALRVFGAAAELHPLTTETSPGERGSVPPTEALLARQLVALMWFRLQ